MQCSHFTVSIKLCYIIAFPYNIIVCHDIIIHIVILQGTLRQQNEQLTLKLLQSEMKVCK